MSVGMTMGKVGKVGTEKGRGSWARRIQMCVYFFLGGGAEFTNNIMDYSYRGL